MLNECDQCRENSHAPGMKFYTTAQYDGIAKQILGPFATHQEAIDSVETARGILANDYRAPFIAFGTIGVRSEA